MKYRDIMTKGTWMLDVITNDEDSGALVEYTVVKYNMTLLEAYRSWHCGGCQAV